MNSEQHLGFGVALEQLPWRQCAPGLREKVHETRDRRFRIVEFSEQFRELDWCTKGHRGYVLKGEMIVNVDGQLVTYRGGDVIDLPTGTRHRHDRTIEIATLFLIENRDDSATGGLE